MTPNDKSGKTAREQAMEREVQELRAQLQGSYEHLTDVTSRLLLANEAADAALSTHDRVELSERVLRVCINGAEASRAAIFLVDGDGFSIGTTYGLDDEEIENLPGSEDDVEACSSALDGQQILVLDPDLVTEEVLERSAEQADHEDLDEEALADDEAWDEEEEPFEDDEELDDETLADDEMPEDDDALEEEAESEEAGDDAGADEESAAADSSTDDAPAVTLVEGVLGEAVFSLYLPVHLEGKPIAVLGLGERSGGRPYAHDQIVFMRHLMRQFAVAVHRSVLIEQNEERLKELSALLRLSREITSTLDIDAVMRGVVNTVSTLVENDRAEILLLRDGKLGLRAVSGRTRVDHDQIELFKMQSVLEYLRLNPRRLQVSSQDIEAGEDVPGKDVFTEYFTSQEMSSFMSLPLKDDQGLLGFLCLESHQAEWDVEPAEGDALDIVAAQTSVAIRNAQLYTEIPFRQVGQPVQKVRSRLKAMGTRKRSMTLLALAAVVIAAMFPILPDRAGGSAEVRPLRFIGARSLAEGIVTNVLVHGGERVRAGQPLALIEDLDLAERVARLSGDIEVSRRGVAEARRAGDMSGWRAGQIELAALERTLAVARRRASSSQLTAPFDGHVLELNLRQRVGEHLEVGQSFCTVASLDSMSVEIDVSENKIGKVRIGQPVRVKVHAFPGRTFKGHVTEVGWFGEADASGTAQFIVRAAVENRDGALRPGMSGIAKASIGWRSPAGAFFEPLVRRFQLGSW